jgi:hypothetical protein
VIISVIAVPKMQPAIMDIVHVGAVLHHGVFFTLVPMGVIIAGDAGHQLFIRRIGGADFERVLVNMAIMHLVEVAIVKVIDMAAMIDRSMAASFRMGMGIMCGMDHLMRGQRAAEHRKRGNRCEESYHGQSPSKVTIPRAP